MLEFTGERYLPSESGLIKYEHLHRYALASQLVADKTVLDIAAGEGYGAALLAKYARGVTGVDIDPQVVEHANAKYAEHPNLKFLSGSCAAIPLPDASVEVITSFETIEHHTQHEEMMAEFKRVLQPGGLLLISSPNRLVYSDLANYYNPYHVKELYEHEFTGLLQRHFAQTTLFGQRLTVGSFVYELRGPATQNLPVYAGNDDEVRQEFCPFPATKYFLALCSDAPLPSPTTLQSLFIQPDAQVLDELTAIAATAPQRQAQLARLTQERQALEQELMHLRPLQAETQRHLDEIIKSRAWHLMQFLWRWKTRLSLGSKHKS